MSTAGRRPIQGQALTSPGDARISTQKPSAFLIEVDKAVATIRRRTSPSWFWSSFLPGRPTYLLALILFVSVLIFLLILLFMFILIGLVLFDSSRRDTQSLGGPAIDNVDFGVLRRKPGPARLGLARGAPRARLGRPGPAYLLVSSLLVVFIFLYFLVLVARLNLFVSFT
ncbi:WD domain-containing protein [Apiospora arundinis]